MLVASLALFTLVPDASACGGFFCNNIEPVEQAGEHIVFEVDGASDQTTMHIQVAYQGPASEFAWIVPVSGVPDLFISNDALFRVVDQWTRPQFAMYTDFSGECLYDWAVNDSFNENANGGPPAPAAPQDPGGVTVLEQAQVGPYETVTLSAESEDDLVSWLQANGYAIPNLLGPVLAPYVSDRHNFVALRLASGNDAGDLAPLGMRYEGTVPAIPIQLTSVAAADDMQLIVSVLGDHRAVPTNYLHVEVNEAAIDWFSWGSNYMDVISRAADEAGGHAFATEFAGSTENLRGTFYQASWADLALDESTGPMDFVSRVTTSGIPASQALLDVLMETVPVPESYDSQSVYNCPDCYTELDGLIDFDAAFAAEQMNSKIFGPLAEIEGMFERNNVLTRLGSTVSPDEMTVDPHFGFNELMSDEVSNYHEARLVYLCDEEYGDGSLWEVPRELELPNGSTIRIPSDRWLTDHGTNASEYLASLQEPAAILIEETSVNALPVVIFDGTDLVDQFIEQHNEDTEALESAGGCGCTTAPGGAAAVWLLGLVPLFLRRRSS